MLIERENVDPSYFNKVTKQLDKQSRQYARALHEDELIGRYAYGAYGLLDGLNLALTIPKLVFEETYSYTDISPSGAWHDWMTTPEGIALMVVESVALVGLAASGSLFDEKDSNAYKSFLAWFWPYLRDVLKALKWAYKGVRNTLLAIMPLVGEDLHAMILPLGIALGVLSVLNRIWIRWMRAERKAMMKDNAVLQAQITETGCSFHVMTALPDATDIKTYINSYILVKKHCGLLQMKSPPTQLTLNQLPDGLDAAYIRCQDMLFYVDKSTRKISMICNNKAKIWAYDNQFNNPLMPVEQPLSGKTLKMIEREIGHAHSPNKTRLCYIKSDGTHEAVAVDDIHAVERDLNNVLVENLLKAMNRKLLKIKQDLGIKHADGTDDTDALCFRTHLDQPSRRDSLHCYSDPRLFNKYVYITGGSSDTKTLVHIGHDGQLIPVPFDVCERFECDFLAVQVNKNLIGLTPEQINQIVIQHDGKHKLLLMSLDKAKEKYKNCYVWDGEQLAYIHANGTDETNITLTDKPSFLRTLDAIKADSRRSVLSLSALQVRELITEHVAKDYHHKARRKVGLDLADWLTYRRQVVDDLELMSVNPDDEIDVDQLPKDMPILIKHGNNYFIYGCVDVERKDWTLTELDAGVITGAITNTPPVFPDVGRSTKTLHYHAANKHIYEHIKLKQGHIFRSKIKSQSEELQVRCYLMAAYSGFANSLYFYMGAMSLAIFIPPIFVAMMIMSTVFAITFITTSLYEEYDFQRKLRATETKDRLALYSKELDILIAELGHVSELVAQHDVVHHPVGLTQPVERTTLKLTDEQEDLLNRLEMQLQAFLACQEELDGLIVLSYWSAGMDGLKNGLAVQGTITSFMFAVATIIILLSAPCPPIFVITCAVVGMACLLAFLAHSLMNHHYQVSKTMAMSTIPLAEQPQEKLNSFLNRLKDMRGDAFTLLPGDIIDSKTDIWDRPLDPSPQFFIVEWCENLRQLFSGGVKGEKFVGEFTGDYHADDTPFLFVLMAFSAVTAAVIFLLRTLAKFFGCDPVDAAPKKPTDLPFVNVAIAAEGESGIAQTCAEGESDIGYESDSPGSSSVTFSCIKPLSPSPDPYSPRMFSKQRTKRNVSENNFGHTPSFTANTPVPFSP